MVYEFKLCIALYSQHRACFGSCVPFSLCPSPICMLSLSLKSKNETLKKSCIGDSYEHQDLRTSVLSTYYLFYHCTKSIAPRDSVLLFFSSKLVMQLIKLLIGPSLSIKEMSSLRTESILKCSYYYLSEYKF